MRVTSVSVIGLVYHGRLKLSTSVQMLFLGQHVNNDQLLTLYKLPFLNLSFQVHRLLAGGIVIALAMCRSRGKMDGTLKSHTFNTRSWGVPLVTILCCLIINPGPVHCQQSYVGGPAATGCTREVDGSPGYTTGGGSARRCDVFITFRTTDRFANTSSISQLFKTDPGSLKVVAMNGSIESSSSLSTGLELNQLVVITASSCSNSGNSSLYYQMKVSYIVQPWDSLYSIANQVFQGLTTCQAILLHNPTMINGNITVGAEIAVPLRCACPTKTQTKAGITTLMTYTVTDGDTVDGVSAEFEVDPGLTFKANNLTQDSVTTIYPFSTLLVPFNKTQTSTIKSEGLSPPHNNSSKAEIFHIIWFLAGLAAGCVGTVSIHFLWIDKCTLNCCTKTNNNFCC